MFLDTVQTVWNFIQKLVSSMLTVDIIFYIGIGFTLLMILFFFIKSSLSYEVKLSRTVDRLNNWLGRNRNITASNLIEFNNLIKDRRSPKILRKHWQQFMLYRDKLPSEYLSAYNCIEKPSKTSSFSANIKNFTLIYLVTAAISFFLNLVYYSGKADTVVASVSLSLLTPVTIVFIGVIASIVLRLMQNYNLASLYQTFHLFNRGIDNASVTIPKYVDFEVLFTQKEIKEGIPVLGEYLEKRARQEQEELEEAQRNVVSHEEYDFASSGVDGSLVLERAMKESETYINAKQRLLAEIQQFESEITTLSRNYENTAKDFQRKLQASKENMERLRQQQEESTNRIEVNYIRKQQQDEVRKQEQLEKDLDDTTNKYNVEVNSLNEEIEKRRSQIEERRIRVQEAMDSEYQTFASKLHETIQSEVKKASEDDIQKLSTEKDQYAQAIAYLKNETDNKDEIIKAKDQTIEELQKRIANLDSAVLNSQATTDSREQSEEDGEYDEKGYYWFKDGTYYDADAKYHDLEGNVYDEDGNLVAEGQHVEAREEITQENMGEPDDNKNETTEDAAENKGVNGADLEQNYTDEIVGQAESAGDVDTIDNSDNTDNNQEKQNQEDGHYDQKGYYWYNDKTYYDNNGLFHDLNGNVYDGAGNLVDQGQPVETEEQETAAQENSEPNNEGHYGKNGYYWYNDKTYYDNIGLFHDLNGNVFDAQGNLIYQNQTVESEQDDELDISSINVEDAVKEESEQKRKAGRPRKEKQADAEPKRKVGRPKKEKAEEASAEPKRKVGRPRKEKQADAEPKRKVGRPKKEKTGEESTEPKRKVGRPKKESTAENVEVKKKKAGRPKGSTGSHKRKLAKA